VIATRLKKEHGERTISSMPIFLLLSFLFHGSLEFSVSVPECDCFPRYLSSRFQLGFLVLAYSSEYIIFIAFIGLSQSWCPVKSFSVIMLQEVIIVKKKRQGREMYCFPMYLFSASLLISVPSHWLFVTRTVIEQILKQKNFVSRILWRIFARSRIIADNRG